MPGKRNAVRSSGCRSRLEEQVQADLKARGVTFSYESERLRYVLKPKTYVPDFVLANGVIIEVKGYLTSEDRQKMIAVKEANPGRRICFLFGRAANRLNKLSKTTYSRWAEDHGFSWAEGKIPEEWVK